MVQRRKKRRLGFGQENLNDLTYGATDYLSMQRRARRGDVP
jgi:hypothetical protein